MENLCKSCVYYSSYNGLCLYAYSSHYGEYVIEYGDSFCGCPCFTFNFGDDNDD